jgi:mRNA-degrading endonuclease toxin of MazEF toxin-antitoxin module
VTIRPGDVAVVEFAGAWETKRRPVVIVSSALYHEHRPDVILGVLTSRVDAATGPTDYVLKDWAEAGLTRPSAFRAYLNTYPSTAARVVGHLTGRDWQEIQARLSLALAVR